MFPKAGTPHPAKIKWQNWLAKPPAGYLKNYRADKWAGRLGN
jgi:hypothetical protein